MKSITSTKAEIGIEIFEEYSTSYAIDKEVWAIKDGEAYLVEGPTWYSLNDLDLIDKYLLKHRTINND